MKKICATVWVLLLCCLICLLTNFFANEAFIKNYEAGTYKENKLSGLGFLEPYISYYNEGNLFYQTGNYEEAIEAYQIALSHHPSEQRECKIRINLVLSMIAPIDVSKLTDEDLDQVITTLEEAKEILCVHSCATEDGNGHNKDAQTLKEDIDRLLEELKERQESNSNDSDTTKDDDTDSEDEQSLETEDEIQEQLKEIQRQGNEERNQALSEAEEFGNFDFYTGQSW